MKISVITVAFNSAGTIRDTIESVLRQDYADIEYIVVDGASQDNTLSIVREYEKYISCIISEPDEGIYDAMNKGIRCAKGEIIGILNSDDFFSSPTILSTIAETFKKGNMDAVYGDVSFVRADNLLNCIRYYSSAIFRPWQLRFGMMPAHPSFYVFREVYEKYGLYSIDYKIAADFELLFRFIYLHKIKICYLKKDFVTMRTGGASTSSWKARKRIMKEHITILRKYHIYTNPLILSLRYFYKIWEIIYTKFRLDQPVYNNQVIKKIK